MPIDVNKCLKFDFSNIICSTFDISYTAFISQILPHFDIKGFYDQSEIAKKTCYLK